MKILFTLIILIAAPFLINAQTNLTEGASLLFKNTKSTLTPAEKNKLFIDLHFLLSKDRKQFIAEGDDGKEFPFDVRVMPTDLNKDGKEEIFITYGNSFTSGNTGSSVIVFIKNAAGKYEMNLGFPGMTPDALTTAGSNYPELLIGGPGMEFPVWKWNGSAYVYARKVKDSDYEKLKKTNIEELSKTYTSGLR